MSKEREAFEKLPEIKKRLDMKCVHFNGTWYATKPHMGNSSATASYLNGAWMTWQAAKAQAVPEGFGLVPLKATENMVEAACDISEADETWSFYDIYEAMVSSCEP